MGEIINAGRSSVNNVNEGTEGWVNENVKRELNALQTEVTGLAGKESFYTKTASGVEYDIDAVKDYLTWLKDRPYAGTKIVANSTPWIMAVQIALESLNNPDYDTEKIDGIL